MFKTKQNNPLGDIYKEAEDEYNKAHQLDNKVLFNIFTGNGARIHFGGFNEYSKAFWYEDDLGRMIEVTDIPTERGQYLEDKNGLRYIVCDSSTIAKVIVARLQQSENEEIKSLMSKDGIVVRRRQVEDNGGL